MSMGRHPRIGAGWPLGGGGGGLPAPTLWLFTDDLLDKSANGFTNASASPPTWTANGDVVSPVQPGYADFDSGDYIEYASDTLLNPGTEDFFLSFYWRFAWRLGVGSYPSLATKGTYQSSTGAYVAGLSRVGAGGGYEFAWGNPWNSVGAASGAWSEATWYRYTATRVGNTLSVYIDSTLVNSADVTGMDLTNDHVFRIGQNLGLDSPFTGQMSDFVYCKGSSLSAAQIAYLLTNPYLPGSGPP